MFWCKSKRLHYLVSKNYFVSSDKNKAKLQENSKPLAITHAEGFKNDFWILIYPQVL